MQKRLTLRQEAILRALVEEYISSPEPKPIPSQLLVDKYLPKVSPATIRIDMKSLEEDGLIYQRHSSGGRIPTDLGYRYFVEYLMPDSALAVDDQRRIRHQFYQVQHQLDQWVRLSASIMSQLLAGSAAGIATTPRGQEGRLKHFELLALHETLTLLVVVLQDGTVVQSRLYLDEPTNQDDLSRLAAVLNRRYAGFSTNDFAAIIADDRIAQSNANERTIILALSQALGQHGGWAPDDIYQEGLTYLLEQPDFTSLGDDGERSKRIRKLVTAMDQRQLLPLLGDQPMQSGGVQVVIGGESAEENLKDISIVVSRYGLPGQASGVLGVVGSTRMQYSRAVAIVRYMTEVMNDLLADLYGSSRDTS